MENIKRTPFIIMLIMAVASFTGLFGLKIAGISVVIGVIYFFVNMAKEKQPFKGSALDFKAIGANFKEKRLWLWFIMPLFMDAVCITIAKLFLPNYIDHVLARTEIVVSVEIIAITVLQLAILALAEEIAWRAFFQKHLSKAFSIVPTLIISSIIFAFGHLSEGNILIVTYDIFFVFINSILYGVIFHKTNNAYVSGLSHFIANLFSVIVLVFLR